MSSPWRQILVLTAVVLGYATTALAAGPRQASGPFGGAVPLPRDEISAAERRRIERDTAASIARLRSEGRLPRAPDGGPVLFGWPIAPWNALSAYGYHGISNYVDQNAAFPGQVLDYHCGTRSYDLSSGYNHRGTDIFSWPNPWKYMGEDRIAVVAGAPGVIVLKDDAHPDMSCSFNNNPWNAVYVRQADGSVAWYGHLKQGSATPKGVGAGMAPGEYLGIMGSSGSSTGPHLHFELWEDESYEQLLDPWQGACNALNPESRWLNQRPYVDKRLNDLTVGAAAPVATPPCPTVESPNAQSDYPGNQTAYFTIYLQDLEAAQVTALSIVQPGGAVWQSWTHTGDRYYAASYWYWSSFVPASPAGTWSFRVTYAGQVYERPFNVGTAAAGRVPGSAAAGEPLRVDKLGGDRFRLSWGASCRGADSDFVVYEGAIGDFETHDARTCSTSGDPTFDITAPLDDRYWLVAPRTLFREGSTGSDSTGADRPEPPPAARCLVRAFDCP